MGMKINVKLFRLLKILLIIIVTFTGFALAAQNQDAESLKKRMTAIRQSTNWKDKEQAAKANEEIRKLAKQLMMTNTPQAKPGEDQSTVPTGNQMSEENVELKMKLWAQLWQSFSNADDADLDLAKPVRDEIVAAYKEDSDHSVKNSELINSISTLYLNMSMPGIDAIIAQMPQFKNIRTLVIICDNVCPVDLEDIFSKAAEYNLEQLYVLNFKSGVASLPESIGVFKNLKELSLINNRLNQLPASVSTLTALENLYIDVNPVNTLKDRISGLHQLKNLGVKDTSISEEELLQIHTILPQCTILR